MPSNKEKISNVSTNVITGFLGVGKTSAILSLMAQKPVDEKWSVLVNEFGSVGIDGAIYKAKGIAVKEIPGGCMCCAVGAPLHVAVNRILAETRPDRLLIEPSGLGHPKRILDTLRGEYLQNVLNVKASICLVDPRNLLDERYSQHENFIDQIAMADILVANKTDLCDAATLEKFDHYASNLTPSKQRIIKTQFGALEASLLDDEINTSRKAEFPLFHAITQTAETNEDIKDGYFSKGWVFSDDNVFDFEQLSTLFSQLSNVRIKAIMRTNKGWMVFNIQGELQEIAQNDIKQGGCAYKQITKVDSSADSRLEVISENKETLTKDDLLSCLITR